MKSVDGGGRAVEVSKETGSITAAGHLLKMNWRGLNSIMKRAVESGLEKRDLKELCHASMDDQTNLIFHMGKLLEILQT